MAGGQEVMKRAANVHEEVGQAIDRGDVDFSLTGPLDEAPFVTRWGRERIEQLGKLGATVGFSVDLERQQYSYRFLPSEDTVGDIYPILGRAAQAAKEGKLNAMLREEEIPLAFFHWYPEWKERFEPDARGEVKLTDDEIAAIHILLWGMWRKYGKTNSLELSPDFLF